MRVRRAGFAAAAVLVCSGCGAASHTATPTTRPSKPVAHRVVIDPSVLSPDGKRIAFVKHVNTQHTGGIGYLEVGRPAGRETRALYVSNDACCSGLVWASPHLIVFDDDYRVKTMDVTTGRLTRIADFSDFTVSADGRLVAGWANSGGHSAQTIGVVSIAGTGCRVLPKPTNADDSEPRFSADGKRLFFTRRSFDATPEGPGRVLSVPLSRLRRHSAVGTC